MIVEPIRCKLHRLIGIIFQVHDIDIFGRQAEETAYILVIVRGSYKELLLSQLTPDFESDPQEEGCGEMSLQQDHQHTGQPYRRKLTTLLESSSRTVILQTLSAMLLCMLHPHRKQQTQAAMMGDRKRRRDCW